jgi:hypothetical protein
MCYIFLRNIFKFQEKRFINNIMLMLDHHINDGALTPQGHEQCEGGPSPAYSQMKDID